MKYAVIKNNNLKIILHNKTIKKKDGEMYCNQWINKYIFCVLLCPFLTAVSQIAQNIYKMQQPIYITENTFQNIKTIKLVDGGIESRLKNRILNIKLRRSEIKYE